jgi:hypothetical protein
MMQLVRYVNRFEHQILLEFYPPVQASLSHESYLYMKTYNSAQNISLEVLANLAMQKKVAE